MSNKDNPLPEVTKNEALENSLELNGMTQEEFDALLNEDEGADSNTNDEDDASDIDAASDDDVKTVVDEEDDQDDQDDQDDDGVAAFIPTARVEMVEGYDEKIADFKAQKRAIHAQRTDGDIDMDEHDEKIDLINEAETELRLQQRDAINAARNNVDVSTQMWESQQKDFFAEDANKIYNENELLAAALNVAVIRIANDKTIGNKSGTWILNKADAEVRALINQPAVVQTKKIDPRRPDLSKIPKTLGQMPAAEINDTGDTEFAFIEKLEGMEQERAIRKMTPEQEARWLAS